MGQYYCVVNLNKRQYLNPHKFGDGMKLLEFGSSGEGTMCGLAILLASGNNRGGGDLHSDHPIIGSWAGDRIVIAGDYGDPHKHVPTKLRKPLYEVCLEAQRKRPDIDPIQQEQYAKNKSNLHHCAQEFFEDISEQVIAALNADPYLYAELKRRAARYGFDQSIDKGPVAPVSVR